MLGKLSTDVRLRLEEKTIGSLAPHAKPIKLVSHSSAEQNN